MAEGGCARCAEAAWQVGLGAACSSEGERRDVEGRQERKAGPWLEESGPKAFVAGGGLVGERACNFAYGLGLRSMAKGVCMLKTQNPSTEA